MTQSFYSYRTIRQNLSVSETIPTIEQAFKGLASGNVEMPEKSYLVFEKFNGDLRSMPAYVPKLQYATIKIVNSHPANPQNFGLPTVMALIVAINPESGTPEHILDGTAITSLRTAAASAIATDQLTNQNVKNLGIIGTGRQSKDQVSAHLSIRNFETIHLFDKNTDSLDNFTDWLENKYPKLEIRKPASAKPLLNSVDVLITLTPSTVPIIDSKSIPGGLHINAIGADAPEKQELPDELIKQCQIIVDSLDQASHSGEISQLVQTRTLNKDKIIGTLGDVINDSVNPASDKTLFDSTGLAIQDAAATNAFLNKNPEPDADFDFFKGLMNSK